MFRAPQGEMGGGGLFLADMQRSMNSPAGNFEAPKVRKNFVETWIWHDSKIGYNQYSWP